MKPPITPTAVAKIEDPSNGDTALIFKDSAGDDFTVNLTLELQSLVLAALIALPKRDQKAPAAQHTAQDTTRFRTLLSTGIQPFRLENGLQGLQFEVGPLGALHLAFPKSAIPAIQAALVRLASVHPLDPSKRH